MATVPFPVNPVLTGIAIAYRNEKLIADDVAPRVPVGGESFKWYEMEAAEKFTVPDTRVGRKSMPNEVEFTMSERDGSTQDHGLDDVVPNKDIDNAANIPNYDPVAVATENLTDLMALAREVRVSSISFNPANYAVDNIKTLAGSDQWTDYVNSNPISDILTLLDKCLYRPNIAVLGQSVWSTLRQHPKIAKAVHGNSGDSGVVSRQQVAQLLELDEILVGQAWVNTAKPGQSMAKARAWGNHASFMVRDKLANLGNKRPTFMITAQWGTRIAGQIAEPKVGLRGSVRVRVGESVRELLTAHELGCFIEDAV